MKDALGHGSNSRGGGGNYGDPRLRGNYSDTRIKTAGMRGVGLAPGFHATARPMPGDAARTVFGLRQQMTNTGPGHRAGLIQAIKNFLGG